MKRLYCLVACLTAPIAFADDVADLKQMLEPISTLKGEFSQSVKDKNGELIQATEGDFAIQRPGYFRWESAEPYPQLIVGTPEKLWVYDPDLEQATVREKQPYGQFNPSELLSGQVKGLAEQFEVNKRSEKAETLFILTPKKAHPQYQTIELRFEGGEPTSFRFSDQLNQSTEVRFNEVQVNESLQSSLFDFIPPKGTDVLVDE